MLDSGEYLWWSFGGTGSTQAFGTTFPVSRKVSDLDVIYKKSSSASSITVSTDATSTNIRIIGIDSNGSFSANNQTTKSLTVNISKFDCVIVQTHTGGSETITVAVS